MAEAVSYAQALQEGLFSEALGAALYRALQHGPHGAQTEQRNILALLQAVEEQTHAEISSLMREAGCPPDAIGAAEAAEKIAAKFNQQAWPTLHAWLLAGSRQGRPTYERIRDTAPDPADPRIAAMMRHIDAVEAIYAGEAAGVSSVALALDYLTPDRRLCFNETPFA